MNEDDLTVAIMAGGKSSRMGRNKSFVSLGGKPLVEHVLERVAPLSKHQLLITNAPDSYAYLRLPMVGDIYKDKGPLAGIFTAVFHATTPYTLIVATDMPWLNESLLRYQISLKEEADVIIPRWDKFPEPLHAVYSKAVLPPIEQNLEADRLKVTRFFGQVSVRFVERAEIEQFDPNGRSFANINTPDQLQAAKEQEQSDQ